MISQQSSGVQWRATSAAVNASFSFLRTHRSRRVRTWSPGGRWAVLAPATHRSGSRLSRMAAALAGAPSAVSAALRFVRKHKARQRVMSGERAPAERGRRASGAPGSQLARGGAVAAATLRASRGAPASVGAASPRELRTGRTIALVHTAARRAARSRSAPPATAAACKRPAAASEEDT